MYLADIFVGSVAVIVGVLLIAASLLNWGAAFDTPKTRLLEDRFGRRGARILLAVLGLVVIGLGVAIFAGFAPFAERRRLGQLVTGYQLPVTGSFSVSGSPPA